MTIPSSKLSMDIGGKNIILETGTYAHLADGAVTITSGDTIVLVTACMGKDVREGLDFFPLTVEYQEKFYATGKIKGSRFIKREGRPPDGAILAGRVIDRSIRPMFPNGMRNEVQVVISILSCDRINDPDVLGIAGASAALNLAGIPFESPISGVRVGYIDGKYIINPTYQETEKSELDIIVSGTEESITMVEAGAKEVTDEVVLGAIDFAHTYIKQLCAFQKDFAKQFGKPVREATCVKVPDEVMHAVYDFISKSDIESLYGLMKEDYSDKVDIIKEKVMANFKDKIADTNISEWTKANVADAIKYTIKKHMRRNLVDSGKRLDGRTPKDIRQIDCMIDVLPRPHGSAIFKRGDTQALSVTTLGSPGDAQTIEEMDEDLEKRYMHHYNFPPFSTGEVGQFRGTGRREIGHGYLAERALEPVLPGKEEFPYTIRVVSEIMSSNGSSSMASTCGSSLSLMSAGVPIKRAVAGVAMGVVIDDESDKYVVLSDIQGEEDFLGDMDFKVAGTEKGITALQLDMKVKGMPANILKEAITQGHVGRDFIMGKMNEVISESKKELSQYAPLILQIEIDPDKIRDVIGKGGETIQKITKECDVQVDIDDIGLVIITAPNQEAGEKARAWVKKLTYEPKVGEVFEGEIKRIEGYGMFVGVTGNKDGLVHISRISQERLEPEDLLKMFKVGQMVKVKLNEIDREGRYNLSIVQG